jgi:hypothetical protein
LPPLALLAALAAGGLAAGCKGSTGAGPGGLGGAGATATGGTGSPGNDASVSGAGGGGGAAPNGSGGRTGGGIGGGGGIVDTPATWINPPGSVTQGSNPFGIYGYWYAFNDGATSTATGDPYKSGAYCVTGTALADGNSAHWGVGIGLDLSGTATTKNPYQFTGKVTGFRIKLTGSAPATPRVHFVTSTDSSAVSPFVPATMNQSTVYNIADARVPLDWNVSNAGQRVDGGVLYSLQVQVPGDTTAGPINVCISEFEPVYDTSDAGTSADAGGVYINPDGWIDPSGNSFGIGGQVYAIGDGTSTTQSGNPYMNGKYCVAGTFTGASGAWGAGIAFDLNHMPGGSRGPYAWNGKVGGFRITLSGSAPGAVHVAFVTDDPPAGTEPFLVARLGTTKVYRIGWAEVPSSWNVTNAGATVGASIYTLQVMVDGAKAGPFNVCVDDITPLPDNMLDTNAQPAATGFTGSLTVDPAVLASEYANWKANRYVDCGDGSACVPRTDQNDCISEGVGYGMLITVGNNDQAAFDKLWAYFTKHKIAATGMMAWQTNRCGSSIATGAATDGDLDAAMALIQAGCKWGGTYRAQAMTLITALRNNAIATCSGQTVLKPGDNFGGCDRTDPSYFAPAYYKVFQSITGDTTWRSLTDSSYTLLASLQAKMNGLVPNWTNSSAAILSGTDGTYGEDASRTPWRIATDYAWNNEARAATFLNNVSQYIDANGGIARLFSPNSAYRGGLATSGLPQSSAKAQAYTDAWLMTSSERDDDSYYPGTLRLIYMLLMSNTFAKGC